MTRAIVAAVLGAAVICAGQTTQTSSALAEADSLAAESLRHSAGNMSMSPGAPGRVERLVALSMFAEQLAPGDPETNRLLIGIYERQGKFTPAARAAKARLSARPSDHALGLLWLRLELVTRDTAETRIAFLESVAADRARPAALRAEAIAMTTPILLGRAEKAKARASLERVLKADPYHPGALSGRLELTEAPKPEDRVRTALALLHANPRDYRTISNLAVILDELGLYDQALVFFDHAEKIMLASATDAKPAHDFLVGYFDAMLDAGRAKQAAEKFQPVLKNFPESMDLQSLLIEAFRLTGEKDEADELIKAMEAACDRKKPVAQSSLEFATEIAWFYLLTRRRANTALIYARMAERIDAVDPIVRRIVGVAELASGRPELVKPGVEKLKALFESDVYAACFLAEHYFGTGRKAAATEALLAGAKISRSGPAYRRLLALAKANNVDIPPADGSEAAAAEVKAFDVRYLEMALSPEKFLAVTIRPVRDRIAPGEPIAVEATLTNTSAVNIPLGEYALFNPVMGLEVSVEGMEKMVFNDLPLVFWPAPRYLRPGESVRASVRLDVGKLGVFLASRPLETLSLNVTGMLNPVQYGREFRSWVPTVKPKHAKITRLDLLASFAVTAGDEWRKAYRLALGYVVRDMKRGSIAERMRAARQVGSLLALVREVELGRHEPPSPHAGDVTKPVLLTMLREVLKDSSPTVRAEMLASLNYVSLDKSIVRLLSRAVEDTSSLVRFRMVELIGASGTPGRETIVDYLAQDKDQHVRRMAEAFAKPGEKTE